MDRAEVHLLKFMYKRAQNDKYLSIQLRETRIHEAKTLLVPFPVSEMFQEKFCL